MTSTVRVLAISGKRFFGKSLLATVLTEKAGRRGHPLLRCALADHSKLA